MAGRLVFDLSHKEENQRPGKKNERKKVPLQKNVR